MSLTLLRSFKPYPVTSFLICACACFVLSLASLSACFVSSLASLSAYFVSSLASLSVCISFATSHPSQLSRAAFATATTGARSRGRTERFLSTNAGGTLPAACERCSCGAASSTERRPGLPPVRLCLRPSAGPAQKQLPVVALRVAPGLRRGGGAHRDSIVLVLNNVNSPLSRPRVPWSAIRPPSAQSARRAPVQPPAPQRRPSATTTTPLPLLPHPAPGRRSRSARKRSAR